MRLRLEALLRPYWLLLFPLLLSFGAWVLPWEGARKGFEGQEPLTVTGVSFLIVWYGALFAAAHLGYRRGVRSRPVRAFDTTPDRSYYRFFTIVAAIGVAYSYLSVAVTEPGLLGSAFSSLTFNEIRDVLPLSAGVHTLRYASILAGGVALYRLFGKRELTKLHVLNILLLLASAAIASRLSIVLAVLLAFGIAVRDRRDLSIRPRTVVGIVVLFFLVTTPLNYVRNAGFYKLVYQTDNPFLMNTYEMLAYLGAPFQGSLGVANHVPELDEPSPGFVLTGMARYVTPEYLPVSYEEVYRAELEYRTNVDIEPILLTNSVVANMVSALGLAAFPFATVLAFAAALLAGHASRYRSYFFLVQVIIGYAFAELWRIYLFNQGILHFLVVALLVLPVWGLLRGKGEPSSSPTLEETPPRSTAN